MLQNYRAPISERATSQLTLHDGHDLGNKIEIGLDEFGPSRNFCDSFAISKFRVIASCFDILHDIKSWVRIKSMMFDRNPISKL